MANPTQANCKVALALQVGAGGASFLTWLLTFWPTGERHSLPGATGDVEAGLGPATVQGQHAVLNHYH